MGAVADQSGEKCGWGTVGVWAGTLYVCPWRSTVSMQLLTSVTPLTWLPHSPHQLSMPLSPPSPFGASTPPSHLCPFQIWVMSLVRQEVVPVDFILELVPVLPQCPAPTGKQVLHRRSTNGSLSHLSPLPPDKQEGLWLASLVGHPLHNPPQ